jgi:hypothetical protein
MRESEKENQKAQLDAWLYKAGHHCTTQQSAFLSVGNYCCAGPNFSGVGFECQIGLYRKAQEVSI